jgi:hypothetical protein
MNMSVNRQSLKWYGKDGQELKFEGRVCYE